MFSVNIKKADQALEAFFTGNSNILVVLLEIRQKM